MRQQATAHREVRAGLGAGELYQGRHTMSNTPEAEYDSKAALSKAQAAITAARKRLENT